MADDIDREQKINPGPSEIDQEEVEDDEEEEDGFSVSRSAVGHVGLDFVESQSQILDSSSSILLPVTHQDVNLLGFGQFKGQAGAFQQVLLASELSPASVTQSTLSAPGPTKFESKRASILKSNDRSVSETVNQNCSVQKSSVDGYKWRKYGQKQVKSTKGSRSYYRCTFSDCCSKKIKCSDQSGSVLETIYRGPHNHEPPRKANNTKESKLPESAVEKSSIVNQDKSSNVPDPSSSSRAPLQEAPRLLDGSIDVYVKDEQIIEPEPKQRLKKRGLESPGSSVKLGKKPKLVVHADGDVGISSDGYRWRKYGQKMVKGNRHPRNYYRCTSTGCPVRKHIETSVENTSALIITYKGVHNHDTPVPKKRQAPPSALLVADAVPASMSNIQQLKRCDTALLNQQIPSSTQWSLDTEGVLIGETLNQGGEKTMDSARTLLSVGFEIKPC